MSDSEFTNSSGGLSRRENERPTPINLSKSLISQQIGYSVECTRKSNFRSAQIDFLPSPLGEGKRKAAFTLAEVLITLGIIGVVAALTLPTLISNYQKRVYVTQLKKSVSVLSQGFTTMMGHDGVTELKDTNAYSGMTSHTCDSENLIRNNDACSSIIEGLQSVFSGIKFASCGDDNVENKYLNGQSASFDWERRLSSHTCIMFPDGSEIIYFNFNKDSFSNDICIDINGPKNPNTWGRDIFELVVFTSNGVVVPRGSQAYAMKSAQGKSEDFLNRLMKYYYWRAATGPNRCDLSAKGSLCAGRVLEEDAMNY